MPIYQLDKTILDAVVATGAGASFEVKDYEFITFIFGTANSANATTKFQGSASNAAPDFTATATVANHWDFVDTIDAEDGASIDGDTGIVLSGSDDIRIVTLNVRGLSFVSANVTAWVAGNITVKVSKFNYGR